MPIDPANTSEAELVITVTAPSGPTITESGTLTCILNGETTYVSITAGMDVTEAAAAIVTGLQTLNTSWETIESTLGVITLGTTGVSATYIDAGQMQLTIRGSDLLDVTGVAIENGAAPFNPDIADYIAVLPDSVINLFVNPYNETAMYTGLQTEIDRRFGSTVQLEGHQIIGTSGSPSAVVAEMTAYNDAHLTYWNGGFNRPCPSSLQAAAVAGIMTSSISEDPAVPMQYLDIVGVSSEQAENEALFEEQNALVAAGVAIGQVDSTGNVETLRLTTTYTDTDGLPDYSYRDANTIFTTSYLRQSLIRLIGITYKNYKLADDGIQAKAGQKIATPKRITATILGWFRGQEELAIVEDYNQFKTQLIVVRNTTDETRVDSIIPTNVVNQFRIFAGELQFLL
jgi:phage tail sheath gpL-like